MFCIYCVISLSHTHIYLSLHRITPDSLNGIRALGSFIQAHVHEESVDRCSSNLRSLHHIEEEEEEEVQHEYSYGKRSSYRET